MNTGKKKLTFVNVLMLAFFATRTFAANHTQPSVTAYRYESFKKLLKQYQRPFTMLELFAGNGNLSFTVAKKYNAVCVMLESNNENDLLKRCLNHSELENIVLITRACSIADLARLGECEHFDIVFAPNIAHYYADWQGATKALLTFGDYVILQAPPYDSTLKIAVENFFISHGGQKIAMPPEKLRSKTGDIYLFIKNKDSLKRRRWDYSKPQKPGEYKIVSTFSEKTLIKRKEKPKGETISSWCPGINLWTFKKLNGAYPTHTMIRDMIQPMADLQHNDLHVFNLIIQGKHLEPIDGNEKDRNHSIQKLLPELLNHFRKIPVEPDESSEIEMSEH